MLAGDDFGAVMDKNALHVRRRKCSSRDGKWVSFMHGLRVPQVGRRCSREAGNFRNQLRFHG